MSIADTFRNGTVFVTGSTGFLGKILTEKLLRSCDVKCIAILVRSKRGLPASQRAADIFKQPVSIHIFCRYLKLTHGNLFLKNLLNKHYLKLQAISNSC